MRPALRILFTLCALVAVILSPLHGQATEDEREAQTAAEEWLSLIDADQYAESWNEAAEAFQGSVTAEEWAEQVAAVRQQVGTLEERELTTAQSATDPPQAPPGDYVVLIYSSTFADVPNATEQIVMFKEADGTWKAMGYVVQPAD